MRFNRFAKAPIVVFRHCLLWSACSCFLAACNTDVDGNNQEVQSENAIKIAVFANFKDNADPFARGAQMAADEVNAAGGIGGRDVELIYRNAACNSATAEFEAISIVDRYPEIVALAGPECSGAGAAVNAVLGAVNMPIVAFTTSSPALSVADTYYRLQASDLAVIEGFTNAITSEADLNEDGNLTVGVIYSEDPFTAGLGEGIVQRLTERGENVAAVVSFPNSVTVDFDQYVTELFASSAVDEDYEVLVLMAFDAQTANLTQQIEQYTTTQNINLNNTPIYVSTLKPAVLSDSAFNLTDNLRALSPDGALSSLVFPNIAAFLERYNAYWGASETLEDAAQGYDAAMLLMLALHQAQVLGEVDVAVASTAQMRAALVANLQDVSRGVEDFEQEGDQANTAYIYPGDFSKVAVALESGQDINYNGAIGFIDFDDLGDINYGAFYVKQPVFNGTEFELINIDERCFGPLVCEQ